MKKVFGVEAELNITADEELVKGLGKGISKGAVTLNDIIKDARPAILTAIKNFLEDEKQDNSSKK